MCYAVWSFSAVWQPNLQMCLRPPIKLELKTQLHRRFAVLQYKRRCRIVCEEVEIVNTQLEKCLSIFIVSSFCSFIHSPITRTLDNTSNGNSDSVIMGRSAGSFNVVLLNCLVVFTPEPQM